MSVLRNAEKIDSLRISFIFSLSQNSGLQNSPDSKFNSSLYQKNCNNESINNYTYCFPPKSNRRRTCEGIGLARKTHQQWLALKNEEARRKSMDFIKLRKIRELNEKLEKLNQVTTRKTYEQWITEKNDIEKKKILEDKTNRKEKLKELEDQKEHELKVKNKYEQWVQSKYMHDITQEELLLQKTRLK